MSSGDNNTGEKSEEPSAKKLRDARKDGNVPKSKDLSQTITLLVWGFLILGLSSFYLQRISALFEYTWVKVDEITPQVMKEMLAHFATELSYLIIMPMVLVSVVGVFTEFIQTGPIVAIKKITPDMSHLHPVQGLKKIFSIDNVVEVGKSMLKTVVIASVLVGVVMLHIHDIINLAYSSAKQIFQFETYLIFLIILWVIPVFVFLTILDWLYQYFSHRKKLRMSKYDVRKEHKQQEGDPMLKGHRKQLHKKWATQNVAQATQSASALVVNPTHIAIALYYDDDDVKVPIITAKGEGAMAQIMRESALDNGIPIVRNIKLARALNYLGEEDECVPEDFFQAVAEVLAWADYVKRQAESGEKVSFYLEVNDG